MLELFDRDIQRFERDLKKFAKKAYPFATRNTVNQAAFATQKVARENVREEMTLRNRFTIQSIQVSQARTLRVEEQAAVVGSTADYMEDQEFGAVKAKTGKEGVHIPTSWSSGEGEGAQPRKRLPRKPNQMASIKLQRRRKRGSSRKQQNLIAIKQAAETGRKYVFLDLVRRKGIFKITGSKRRPRIKMVHDMTRQSVVIPRNPWLKPAVDEVTSRIPEFYRQSLIFQLKRNKLFDR